MIGVPLKTAHLFFLPCLKHCKWVCIPNGRLPWCLASLGPISLPWPLDSPLPASFFPFSNVAGSLLPLLEFFFFFLKLSPQRFIFRLDTLCTVSPSLSSSLHPYFSLISLILSLFFEIFPIVPFFLFPLILHLTTRGSLIQYCLLPNSSHTYLLFSSFPPKQSLRRSRALLSST